MTIILVGGLIGAALALIERIVTRIRQASNATVVTTVNDIVGIRRHSTSTGVWHDTTVAGSNDPHGDTSTFFMEEHSPRHGLDDDDTDDLDQTAIIGPSSGRHSADNPNRQLV